jgi:hypothetical protein
MMGFVFVVIATLVFVLGIAIWAERRMSRSERSLFAIALGSPGTAPLRVQLVMLAIVLIVLLLVVFVVRA